MPDETQYEKILRLTVAIMETVPDIGKIHKYLRMGRDEKAFRDFFVTTVNDITEVRGWLVTVKRKGSRRGPTATLFQEYNVKLLGYMGLDDARQTEITFGSLIEELMVKLDAKQRLGDVAVSTPAVVDAGPSQNIVRDYIKLSGVLCHYAELDLPVTVQRSVTYS